MRQDYLDEQVFTDMAVAQRKLEVLINSTPTSVQRSHLCECNIHLMAAIGAITNYNAEVHMWADSHE